MRLHAGRARTPDDDGLELELIAPEDFLARNPFPLDAQRMGIDRWSDDAGMIAIAASLDSRKLSHKIVAWVMLIASRRGWSPRSGSRSPDPWRQGRPKAGRGPAQPGGQPIDRPPRTCRWAWNTVWCAAGPVLSTSR